MRKGLVHNWPCPSLVATLGLQVGGTVELALVWWGHR